MTNGGLTIPLVTHAVVNVFVFFVDYAVTVAVDYFGDTMAEDVIRVLHVTGHLS